MSLEIVVSSRFRKELRKAVKRGLDLNVFESIVDALAQGKRLPPKNKDHELIGNYKGYRECHIQNDWLLIYKIYNDELILSLERTGTHSDLFR